MQKFETSGPISVVLSIPAGRVEVTAVESAVAGVEVLPANASKKRDVQAANETAIEFGDGVLRIATAKPNRAFGSSGSLTVQIEVPAGSRIEGKAGAVELYGAGRLGEVAFEGAYRLVELEEVAGADLKAHTGQISIERLTGSARISNGVGDITVAEAVAGEVELSTGSGNVSIGVARGVSAALDARTPFGQVHNALKNDGDVALSIKATTGHGNISAASA